jgi:hypothetical protein
MTRFNWSFVAHHAECRDASANSAEIALTRTFDMEECRSLSILTWNEDFGFGTVS